MAHLCIPQNQALGVCRGFVPDNQVCGTHGREDLVNATITSNAEEEEREEEGEEEKEEKKKGEKKLLRPATPKVYPRDGSAHAVVRAATLRSTLQIKLDISPTLFTDAGPTSASADRITPDA